MASAENRVQEDSSVRNNSFLFSPPWEIFSLKEENMLRMINVSFIQLLHVQYQRNVNFTCSFSQLFYFALFVEGAVGAII